MPSGEPLGFAGIAVRDLRRGRRRSARHQAGCLRASASGRSSANSARPSPWATAIGSRAPCHAAQQDRRGWARSGPARVAPRTAPSDCARSGASPRRPGSAPSRCESIWQPLQTPSAKRPGSGEEAPEVVAQRDRGRGSTWPSRRRRRARRRRRTRRTRRGRGRSRSNDPPSRSLMWTSMHSKPARSKAAAISICPFTPCSRRIAMRGRRPPARRSAGSLGRRESKGTKAERVPDRRGRSAVRAPRRRSRIVAESLHAPGGLRPDPRSSLAVASSSARPRPGSAPDRRLGRPSGGVRRRARSRESTRAPGLEIAALRICRTAPSSSLKSLPIGDAPSRREIDLETACRQRRPSRRAWRTARRPSGRDRRAASAPGAVPGSPRRRRAGWPDRRRPAARRRVRRGPGRVPRRRGDCGRARDRRAGATCRPVGPQLRGQGASRVVDRCEGRHDQRDRRRDGASPRRLRPRPCASTSSPCRPESRSRGPGRARGRRSRPHRRAGVLARMAGWRPSSSRRARTWPSETIGAEARLVSASPTAMRAAAARDRAGPPACARRSPSLRPRTCRSRQS